jgi:hypothetical protein
MPAGRIPDRHRKLRLRLRGSRPSPLLEHGVPGRDRLGELLSLRFVWWSESARVLREHPMHRYANRGSERHMRRVRRRRRSARLHERMLLRPRELEWNLRDELPDRVRRPVGRVRRVRRQQRLSLLDGREQRVQRGNGPQRRAMQFVRHLR